jgi:hypothetical protein
MDVTDQSLTPTGARATANTYHFITQWRVQATLDDVTILATPPSWALVAIGLSRGQGGGAR